MPHRIPPRGPSRGSVLDTISSLSREDLEQFAMDVAAQLYLEDGRWSLDTMWTTDTLDEIARAVPANLRAAVRAQAGQRGSSRSLKRTPWRRLVVADENGLRATPEEAARVITALSRDAEWDAGLSVHVGSARGESIEAAKEVDWAGFDAPRERMERPAAAPRRGPTRPPISRR